MRIAGDLAASKNFGTSGGLLEQSSRRSGTMSDDRRLGKEPQRFLPEFQPHPDRRRLIQLLVNLVISQERRGRPLQLRRCRPRQRSQYDRRAENDEVGPPFQMKQREY